MIRHAAILKDGIIYIGHRHHDCIRVMSDCGMPWPVDKGGEQGFITVYGEFVDRQEAFVLAKKYGQLRSKIHEPGTLYSEDLY